MKKVLVCFSCCFILSTCCGQVTNPAKFLTKFTKAEYLEKGRAFGIDNDQWIERLYRYSVNVNNFKRFKKRGVDLNQVYGKDYKSRVLTSEVIVTGDVIAERYNTDPDVYFHSEYTIQVDKVLKTSGWTPSDTLLIQLKTGTIGKRKYKEHGENYYSIGEKVVLYLEPVQETIKYYDNILAKNDGSSRLPRTMNAKRNDPNSFRPLKKYIVKGDKVIDANIKSWKVEKSYKRMLKNVKKIEKLNKV